MIVRVGASHIDGCVAAPSSKSYTQRALVCGLLSRGVTRIRSPLLCSDTIATINACRAMGATVELDRELTIESEGDLRVPSMPIDCQGSGTTLRLFMGVSALVRGTTILTGDSTLRRRPVGQLMAALEQLGAGVMSLEERGLPPVMVDGRGFTGGIARLEGDVSSQFVSALLLACPRGSVDSHIELTTRLESVPYVKMTLEMMQRFGVHASVGEDWREFSVPAGQTYRCCDYDVEGDYSSTAFILAAGALCGRVRVCGLSHDSLQGDALIVDILREMGARVSTTPTTVTVEANELRPVDVDVSDTPDLVPILAVLASQARGLTTLRGVRRLRIKESDRVDAISNELSKMGASIHSDHDTMTVSGPTPLRGAVIDPHKDHRIAMACTIAALVASGETIIVDAGCVAKSYPDFFATLKTIGADVEERPGRPTPI